MTEETKKCPHCGASMKAFWHRLSPGLVGSLIKAIEVVKRTGKNSFHLARDLSLTKTEYNNFQKLRFHALVAKDDANPSHWLITKRGGQFLRGEISVSARVNTYRNKVIGHTEDLIHIKELKHQFPEFQSQFAFEYKQPVGITKPATLFDLSTAQ